MDVKLIKVSILSKYYLSVNIFLRVRSDFDFGELVVGNFLLDGCNIHEGRHIIQTLVCMDIRVHCSHCATSYCVFLVL